VVYHEGRDSLLIIFLLLMTYLYHMVPADMTGNILYPLNLLKQTHPELYAVKVKKYQERTHVMEQSILPLNCLWNDVLHFTAIHPADIKAAMLEAGSKAAFRAQWFEIDPMLLDSALTTVYLHKHTNPKDMLAPSNFADFVPSELAQYAVVPERTKAHYRAAISRGQSPLAFYWAPHILYKGSLDTSLTRVIVV
jgi:hypothetical protein